MRNARSLEQFAEVVAFRSTPLQFLRTAVEDDAAAIAVNLLTCSLREEGKGRHFVGERSKDWNEKHSRSSDQMQLDLACKEKKEAIHGEHKVGCRKKDGTTSMEWNCSEPFLTSCGIQKQELLEMREWKLMISTGIPTTALGCRLGIGACYRGSILDKMPVHSADTGYQRYFTLF
jgi:hypothetical protein